MTCWGANGYGQLGDGTTTDSPLPVAVAALPPAVAIAAGYNHTCAVLASGEARCWGWNAAGQLGDGTMTDSPTPVAVPSLSRVTTIAGGGFHTCAGSADGVDRLLGLERLRPARRRHDDRSACRPRPSRGSSFDEARADDTGLIRDPRGT